MFKTEQSCKLQKQILANQEAIWKIRLFHVDHITVETLSSNLQGFWTKSVGGTANNVRGISRPPGGAVKGRCEKCWAKFFPMPVGSVHTKFETDRWSYR